MGGAFYCVVAARSQVNNVDHNKRSGAFCWLAQTSLLVGGQLTLLLTLFFSPFQSGWFLPWFGVFTSCIRLRDTTHSASWLGLLATPLLAHYMKGK